MSPRVIKLAQEAGVLRTEYAAPSYGVHSEPALADIARLVELVVEDCARQVDHIAWSGRGTLGTFLRSRYDINNE
jgi:hypothetical protein